jgi:hypothetical protein
MGRQKRVVRTHDAASLRILSSKPFRITRKNAETRYDICSRVEWMDDVCSRGNSAHALSLFIAT